MKNLITEARELCEGATSGKWKRHDTADYAEIHNGDTWGKNLNPIALVGHTDDANFIARSRTLIPELCDALEKAEEKNTQLVRELSALARESVKRDMALAMMEVEVEAALREVQARESGCVYCINCPEKIIAKKKRYSHATETGIAYDNIKVNFCPICGKRLEVSKSMPD